MRARARLCEIRSVWWFRRTNAPTCGARVPHAAAEGANAASAIGFGRSDHWGASLGGRTRSGALSGVALPAPELTGVSPASGLPRGGMLEVGASATGARASDEASCAGERLMPPQPEALEIAQYATTPKVTGILSLSWPMLLRLSGARCAARSAPAKPPLSSGKRLARGVLWAPSC